MHCTMTKLTLLALLSCNLLQAVEVNFAAEFSKAEKILPFDKELPRHERYAQYLLLVAIESCSAEDAMDLETAKKACQEILTLKNLSPDMHFTALQILASLADAENNYAQAISYLNQMLALPDLLNFKYKLAELNKEQFQLLAQGKTINEQEYQTRLNAIALEAEQELLSTQK